MTKVGDVPMPRTDVPGVTLFLFLRFGDTPLATQDLYEACRNEAQHLLMECLESAMSEKALLVTIHRALVTNAGLVLIPTSLSLSAM